MWLFHETSPEGRLMIRCTTYLTLAACVMAVPGAVAQQPGQGPQNQPRPAGVTRDPRAPAGSPNRVGGMPAPAPYSPNLTPTAPAVSPYPVAPRDNPYLADGSGGTSYRDGPYAADGYNGSGDAGGYGTGGGAGAGSSASAGASSEGRAARALKVILTAGGVPNENGQVVWPTELRLLRPDPLMQQLEAQLRLAVEQVTAGGVNPKLLDQIRLTVEALRRSLLAEKARYYIPRDLYEDAERFLEKLKGMPQILAASPPASRSDASTP